MSDKPKIFGTCPAGCLWETVHKDDFLRSASIVKQTRAGDKFILEAGNTYKIKKQIDGDTSWGFCIDLVYTFTASTDEGIQPSGAVHNNALNTVAATAPTKYDDYLKFKVCGVTFDKTVVITIEVDGQKFDIDCGKPAGALQEYGCEVYAEVYDTIECYLVNEDATIEAKDGKSAIVRYSQYADGTDFTADWRSGQNYVGFSVAETAPTDKSEYTWVFVGNGGSQLKPEFANDTSECTDTSKLYVLPDGYIYAYMKKTVRVENNEYDPAYTDGLNKRIKSDGSVADYNGSYLTDYIEVDYAEEYNVTISGLASLAVSYSSIFIVDYFDASKTRLGYKTNAQLGINNDTASVLPTTFNLFEVSGLESTKYVRVKLGIKDSSTVITSADLTGLVISFEPKSRTTTTTEWHNTGHAFVPADYEDRIIAAEEQIEENTARIEVLEKADNGSVALPDYWQTAADEAVAKVKALQDSIGKYAVNFVWFSDLHYGDYNAKTKHFGKVCAYVMDKLEIPFAVNGGDTLTSAALSDKDTLLSYLESAKDLLSPIGDDRLMLIRGNHDDVYGSNYVNKVAPNTMWNRLHRFQANDFRRVFGGDGTYFYIDNIPQKIRFVFTNSHYYSGDEIDSGTSKNMTSGFGAEQLAWLENTALNFDNSTWDVVVFTHVPPTDETINNNNYLSQLDDGEAFRAAVSNTNVGLIGVFSGHCHVDECVFDSTFNQRVFTITTAGGTPYGGVSASDRVAGTTTEFAFDIVTVDRNSYTVYTTRVGYGSDREILN